MCGRFAIVSDILSMKEEFQFDNNLKFKSNYNVAPQTDIPVIINKELKLLNWGLIPVWAKDKDISRNLINARCETIDQKPSFRHAFKTGRCIIPASGYYEWKKIGKTKQPYYIKPKGHNYFAFAGLWEHNETLGTNTVTIVTTEADKEMKEVHTRMPVLLGKAGQRQWLKDSFDSTCDLNKDSYEFYRVSTDVNFAGNNRPDLIKEDAQKTL